VDLRLAVEGPSGAVAELQTRVNFGLDDVCQVGHRDHLGLTVFSYGVSPRWLHDPGRDRFRFNERPSRVILWKAWRRDI